MILRDGTRTHIHIHKKKGKKGNRKRRKGRPVGHDSEFIGLG